MVWKGDSTGRLAKSLITLIDQLDRAYPNRDRSTDGSIGDAAHQATKSDHNKNSAGVVTALDIDRDIAAGFDSRALAEALAASRDPRIEYIISNGQIINSRVSPWVWRDRNKGSGDHTEHMHISVHDEPALYDDPRPWAIDGGQSTVSNINSGKGSWYSQFEGRYSWVDKGDEPNSAALGCPDDAQGVAFYNQSTLGHWFEVTAPNGAVSIEQQTDIGPNPSTGRLIDISAAAAERMGYSPRNFPTDSIFAWRSVPAPSAVAGLTMQQQAVRYRDLRKEPIVTTTQPEVLPPAAPVDTLIAELNKAQRPVLERWAAASQSASPDALRAELIRLLGGTPPALPARTGSPVNPAAPVAAPGVDANQAAVTTGTLGVAITTVLQALGVVGLPFGLGAEGASTTTGTMSTLIPALTGILGMVGGASPLVTIGLNLFKALGSLASKPK